MTVVIICGGPRTGKTTLAAELAKLMTLNQMHGKVVQESEAGIEAIEFRDASVHPTVRSTDEYKDLEWSEASLRASKWFDPDADGLADIVEGVAAGRALRKWLLRTAVPAMPCKLVVWLKATHEPLTKPQETMAKGCRTVFEEIRKTLLARGIAIFEPDESAPAADVARRVHTVLTLGLAP